MVHLNYVYTTRTYHLSRVGLDQSIPQITLNGLGLGIVKPEDALYDAQFWGRGVETCYGQVIVNDDAGADDVATAINSTSHQWHLEQR